eukprot:scaffold862_cov195-Alexandrium_tamarense.AAC.4
MRSRLPSIHALSTHIKDVEPMAKTSSKYRRCDAWARMLASNTTEGSVEPPNFACTPSLAQQQRVPPLILSSMEVPPLIKVIRVPLQSSPIAEHVALAT